MIESAVAFANTSGGVILIGVSDTGEIKGITIGKETPKGLLVVDGKGRGSKYILNR